MKLRNRQSGEIKEFVLFDGKEMQAGLTLENLARDWEDYVPKEPLIKDEKIRKAVRAWAEANELDELSLANNGYEIYGGLDDTVVQFVGEPLPFDNTDKTYTIAELCGEEEE